MKFNFPCLSGRFVFFSLLLTASYALSADIPTMKLISPKHENLIAELIQKYGFESPFLIPLFKEAVIRPDIIEKFERPPEKLSYFEYRKRFMDGKLLEKGLIYFEENRPLLQKIEEEWEVPKEIIAAILGVETRFGEPGIEQYRAWDVLNTAYTLYPRREAFYKEELISFLVLCKEEDLDPLSIKSSYAGAIGVPQFMPSSFLKFARDEDGNQKRDLWSSKEDIYASVANYLKRAGWKQNGFIRMPAKISGNPVDAQKAIEAGIRETLSVARAMKMGIEIPESVNKEDAVSFVSYKPEEGKDQFLVLFDNFRVITRYNFSVNYALLITELSELLKKGETGSSSPLPPAVPTAPEVPVAPIGPNGR